MKKSLLLITCLSMCSISFANDTTSNHDEVAAQENLQNIRSGGISWRSPPRIQIIPSDLEGQNREITTIIYADSRGKITDVRITQSSGIEQLDQKVLRTIRRASFRPYFENGIAKPFQVMQPFSLSASEAELKRYRPKSNNDKLQCYYNFDSAIWKAQQYQDTRFKYDQQPKIIIKRTDLNGEDRTINFAFKLSRNNEISNIQLLKSSGVNNIDTQVISALMYAKVSAPRKFWQFYKLKFNDSIDFNLEQCP